MTRNVSVSVRLPQYQHIAVTRAATAAGLKVTDWIRTVLWRCLNGEDSTRVSLLRAVLATRTILLNVLLYLAPSTRALTAARLQEICKQVDAKSEAKVQALLAVRHTAPVGTHQLVGQVSTKLTSAEYEQLLHLAAARQLTVADFVRQAMLACLQEDVLQIVLQQVLDLRTILDEGVRHLTSTGEIPRDILAALATRTALAASPDQES